MHGPGVIINRATGVIQGSTNGKVSGGPLNGLIDGSFGIVAYYQTTVINYGSIGIGTYSSAAYHAGTVGPKQFAFDASNRNPTNTINNLIEMAPGASFGGVVKASTGNGSATLELLSGASTGTIQSFGKVTVTGAYYHGYLGFGAVKIDNGARWQLGGTVASGTTVSFAGAGELILPSTAKLQGPVMNFGQGDTIVLEGISVTGSTYASGVLTLFEASGSVAINVPGTFATSDFNVRNVAGNVDVALVQTQDRTLSWIGATNTSFGTPANWNDLTNGFNPARAAPASTDTVVFDTIVGALTGTGTVAAVDVGSGGSGVLQLNNGATLVAGSLDAGVGATDIGQIGLTGAGTKLILTGAAQMADDGTGILSVLNGATLSGTDLTIGSLADSSGAMVVSGAGSVVDLSGVLNIGTPLGVGDLTVGPGASIHASVVNLLGGVVLEGGNLDPTVLTVGKGKTAGGTGTIGSDFIVVEGTIAASGTKPGKSLQVVSGTVVGGGTLTLNGTVQKSSIFGLLQLANMGTMELTGPVLNAATTTFTDDLTPTGTYVVKHSVIDVSFQDVDETLILDDIAHFFGTVTAVNHGDQFVITGGTLSNLGASGNTLTVADSGAGARPGGVDQIMFNAPVDPTGFSIVNGNTIQVACFAAGTRIETAGGPVAVERLRAGDTVRTLLGGTGRITWVGSREIDCVRHPKPETVRPVRINRGAFGTNLPARDLFVSPDHSVYVEGVLIPAHCLINGGTIRQIDVDSVTYYHVELPAHDVILAEDLPVESYLDTGDRANFDNAGGFVRLFPDFSARMWEMAGCAPLVMTGPVVERVKLALARGVGVVTGVRRPAPWTRLNNRYTYY